MIRYNLASLAKGVSAPGTRVKLAPIDYRQVTVNAYLKATRAMLKVIAAQVRETIIPAYQADKRSRLTRDVDQSSFDAMRALAATFARITGETVERILRLESIRHTETFRDEARRALGIDLTAIVRQEDLDAYLKTAIARNTSLIRSQADDVVKAIEQKVIENELNGRSVKDLKADLVERLGIADRRAQLIARDQTAKLNSDMNRIRQEQAGIEEYEWQTAGDERVRSLHVAINGKEYAWGERTGAEGGLPPGQPIQCRCIARAIIDFGSTKKKKRRKSSTIDPITAASIVRTAVRPRPRVAPGPTIPPPIVETREVIVARSNAAAKSYVVDEGIKTTTEYLTAIDDVTGEVIDRFTTGQKGHVGFSPALEAAFDDPKRSVTAHHNHPSSSSFSLQDILELTRRPGISGLWAHGHNGSSYFATPSAKARTSVDATWKAINTIDQRVRQEIQPLVYPKQEIDAKEAGKMHAHLVMRLIEQMGLVGKYEFELKGETKDAVDRHAATADRLFEALKVKRK